jgi:hypothetical protein
MDPNPFGYAEELYSLKKFGHSQGIFLPNYLTNLDART